MKKIIPTLIILFILAGCVEGKELDKKQKVEKPAPQKMIQITEEGFHPSDITVSSGTTVRFENQDTVAHWPASGVHPTHQICPGFDAGKPIEPGASYSFAFQKKKTCPLHDHLKPSLRGSVTVE